MGRGLMVLPQTLLGTVRRASRPWSVPSCTTCVFESIGTLNRRYDMVPLPTQVGRRTRTAKYDYSAICVPLFEMCVVCLALIETHVV